MAFYGEILGKDGKIEELFDLWERKSFPFSNSWQRLTLQGLLIKAMKNVLQNVILNFEITRIYLNV